MTQTTAANPGTAHVVMLDRTCIHTKLRLHPGLLADPNAFIQLLDIPVRTVKQGRGRLGNKPAQKLILDVLTYGGIRVELTYLRGRSLADATIYFNPGRCLYGHNARTLAPDNFLHALAVLVNSLAPLLSDPNDWVDLVPGVRPNGIAYWHYIELPFQCRDPEGKVLSSFYSARRPYAQIPNRRWQESLKTGGDRSPLRISIYYKAAQMVARKELAKERLPEYADILRLELQLKDEKIVKYLGNGRNVEEIDGKQRLVRFYPWDLIQALRRCLSELQGVFSSGRPPAQATANAQLAPLGRLLARLALRPDSPMTFLELWAEVGYYTGASSDTMWAVRDAGLAELECHSPISLAGLLSDAAYQAQPGIVIEELEKRVSHQWEDTFAHPLLVAAYLPPQPLFVPITQFAPYIRL